VVNYHDVEEAEGDAMTTAQIENFRMKLDEAVNSMELLRDYTTETGEEIKGLGPYSEDAFDEMAESGDKLHEKLKALGLTIEHEDGTWERVGRSGKEAHEKIGAATEHTISLQRQLEMAIGDVGNVINGVKDLEDLFGISADSAFGKVVDGAGKAVSAIESIINVIKGMNSLIGTIESIAKAFSNIAGGASATTSAVEGTAAAAGGTATAAGGATTSLAGTAAAIGTVAASAAAFGIVAYGLTRLFFGGERPAFDASDPAQRKEVGDYLAGGGLGYDNVYKGPSGYGGHNTGGPPTDHPTGPPPVHAAAGFYSPSMPAGPLSDGGTMITVHPREEVSVTPEGQTSRGGSSGNMSVTSQPQFHIGTVIGSPDELWSMVAKGLRANNAELVGAIRQISWRG
jgi:hypothetical protein